MLVEAPLIFVGGCNHRPLLSSMGYEWVRDDVLKYWSSISSLVSVATLQCQLRLANLEGSYQIVVQACGNENFPFLRAVLGSPSFFFMYYCLFDVLGLVLPLNNFRCALLVHLNVAPSQLHPNSWAMVKAFEVLCPFFNIRSSV